MAANNAILKVKELKTYFFTRHGVVKAVDGVGFELREGETLCLVGESGCGKTVTALSILRLVDSPPGRIMSGEILYHGEDLLRCSSEQLRRVRGNKIAMIFQDPLSSLNPVLTIGEQIKEPIRLHLGLDDRQATDRAINLMKKLGIPSAERRIYDYPHQLSGGTKQRVMVAMSLSCDPEILIADEPTTAVDVTIKAQILDIFRDLKKTRHMSIIFITHDFGVVAEIADRILVMYGGKIVEAGAALDIFDDPRHPYTIGLMNCLPDISTTKERLTPIPGVIPSLIDPPECCIFQPRCSRAMKICTEKKPFEVVISKEHAVACHLFNGQGNA